jgi:hypothetical protein
MNRLLLVITALMLSMNAIAQAPRTISYQGRLLDGSQQPVTGPASITVKLYDAATGGTAIHTEDFAVNLANGIYSVIIGSTVPLSPSMTFDRTYYLGISVNGGTEMLPRTAMTASPYAFRAITADQASSLDPNAPNVVRSINTLSGNLRIVGGGATTVTMSNDTINISSVGGGSGGIGGVQNTDNALTITNSTGPVATINVASGGIKNAMLADGAVTESKIALGSVTAEKISGAGGAEGNVLTRTAGGGAAWAAPGGGLTLPFSSTVNNASTLFDITNSGTGSAATFKTTDNTSNASGVLIEAAGNGSSLVVQKNVAAPNAAMSILAGANMNTAALFARTDGTGSAAVLRNYNTSNSADAVVGSTAGTGAAGYFLVNNEGHSGGALVGSTNSTAGGTSSGGGPSGVLGLLTASSLGAYSAAVRGVITATGGNGIAIHGYHAGSGWGVYGVTATGRGGFFENTGSSASTAALYAQTAGTGPAFLANQYGSGTRVAQFSDNGTVNGEVMKDGMYNKRYSNSLSQALPIAYGYVAAAGGAGPATANVQSVWNAANTRYEITIANENFVFTNYIVLVTPVNSADTRATYDSFNNKLVVVIRNAAGNPVQNAFSFMVYKP